MSDLDHRPKWTDVECPNCGEGCGGDHPNVQVCAFDEEDWPCAIAEAEARGYQRAIDALRDRERYDHWYSVELPHETDSINYVRSVYRRQLARYLEAIAEASAHTAIRSGESTDGNA